MNRVAPESQPSVSATRAAIRAAYAIDEADAVRKLVARLDLPPERRKAITGAAAGIIQQVRDDTDPTMMEAFLDQYGLSTDEGVGLIATPYLFNFLVLLSADWHMAEIGALVTAHAPLPFQAGSSPALAVSATTVSGGSPLTVTLTGGLGGYSDWLAFASTSAPNNVYLQYTYVGSGQTTRSWAANPASPKNSSRRSRASSNPAKASKKPSPANSTKKPASASPGSATSPANPGPSPPP